MSRWIESHVTLRDHPKTRKAARALGVSIPTIIGHLHCLWHQALNLALDGDLTRWDLADIAHAAMWDGDPTDFVNALHECGFAGGAGFLETTRDDHLVIHDWSEHTGKLRAAATKSAKGNHQRWHVDRDVVAPDCDLCTRERPRATPGDSPPTPRDTHGDSPHDPQRLPEDNGGNPPDLTGPDTTGQPPSAAPATHEHGASPHLAAAVVTTLLGGHHPPAGTRARWQLDATVAELTRWDANPAEVAFRAARWPDTWGQITPMALAKHWGQLGPPSTRPDRPASPPPRAVEVPGDTGPGGRPAGFTVALEATP